LIAEVTTSWRACRTVSRALLVLGMGSVIACSPPATEAGVLRWGGDAEGGAPFVESDPAAPSVVRGFDVEIAETMAAGLGRRAEFRQVAWASIEQSVQRGDVDVGMSGLEDRPGLRERFAVSLPYFEYREVLAVRPADTARFHALADLAGRRVATLGSTHAYRLLLEAEATYGVSPVSYDDDVHPYTDLVEGRVDAVLLDHVIADRALRRLRGGFVIQPDVIARGAYVAVFPRDRSALRDSVDAILRTRIADGTLERIYRRWEIWDADQARHLSGLQGGAPPDPARAPAVPAWGQLRAYAPALLRATALTLGIAVAAMIMAILLGGGIAAGRVYGGRVARALLITYVEIMRGTPVLLQLFVLYYGVSAVIRLPALVAAILGLGLNYAAYESEIYRSALEAVPRSQLEAARTLGLTEWQVLRLVRGPQAFRTALAPMTNDFVALLKDTSLVSVITVVELTKQTAIFATNVGAWLVPGLACASLYLLLSLPLARMARRLETRWRWT